MRFVLFFVSLSLCSCSFLVSKKKTQVDPNLPGFTINQEKYDAATPSETRIRVNRKEQKARLFNQAGEVILETDVSTGIAGRRTPLRTYWVREKIVDKRSNKYGQYVDKETGEVVVKKAWEHKGKRPANTVYRGIAMPYWMRLTDYGIGMHVGSFHKGVPSSFGCIRVFKEAQPYIYKKTQLGTKVTVE